MAVASAPQPKTRRRKAPDPQRVYEMYLFEVKERGEWGAVQRTADAYGKSHEWARKIVNARKPQVLPQGELSYVPAPGEMEIKAIHRAQADAALLCQLIELDIPTETIDITETVSVAKSQFPPQELPTFQSVELEQPKIAYDPFSNRLPDRTKEHRLAECRLATSVTAAISLGLLAIASIAPLLSLAMLLPTLGMWWCVIGLWRLL